MHSASSSASGCSKALSYSDCVTKNFAARALTFRLGRTRKVLPFFPQVRTDFEGTNTNARCYFTARKSRRI